MSYLFAFWTSLAAMLSVASSVFKDGEIIKAKQLLYDICSKSSDKEFVPCLIPRKGDNKRKADTDDIGSFFTLLDDYKVTVPKFIAHNTKRIPPIEPGTTDLCFLLESIEDVRQKADFLINIRQDVADLQIAIKLLSHPQPALHSSVLMVSQQNSAALYQLNSSNLSQVFNSQPQRVNFQPQQNISNSVAFVGPA